MGHLHLPYSSYITATAIDPIEKKPLLYFHRGTHVFSVGLASCNMHCPFCQNHRISQTVHIDSGQFVSVEKLLYKLRQTSLTSIAFTYSEPLIHFEYLLEALTLFRKEKITTILVTNGNLNPEPAAHILSLTDAVNVDLKCYNAETYRDKLGGDLETVKNFIKKACELGVHTEVTTLLVPGISDKPLELDAMAVFLAGLKVKRLNQAPPWHLAAYRPAWQYKEPATPRNTVLQAVANAKRYLPYVHAGNI
jgi:pyruvate formate lyase activating enzyme